jgi:hypothetical protein
MEYESSHEVIKAALRKMKDPVAVVNPIRAEEWSNAGVDIFLDEDMKLTKVMIVERDLYIATLLGEKNGQEATGGYGWGLS